MHFLLRDHVGRTHGSVEFLPAYSEAAAHLDGAAHAAVFRIVEEGGRMPRLVTRAKAKVRGERRRVDDFSGIKNALRIESALDGAKSLIKYRAEHFLVERTADETIAVLAREALRRTQGQGPPLHWRWIQTAARPPLS